MYKTHIILENEVSRMDFTEYVSTPVGLLTCIILGMKILFLSLYTYCIVEGLHELAIDTAIISFAISLVAIFFCLLFIIVPLIFSVSKHIILVFGFLVALLSLTLGMLTSQATFRLGWSTVSIPIFISGIILCTLSIINAVKKTK